ncbi:MAG: penicillin-binding protein [Desulfuromonadales bacterium]|jgi:penicillin-binding protein 1B|nr:penicillin-binding protein [Desulfuromonadales bacterium]
MMAKRKFNKIKLFAMIVLAGLFVAGIYTIYLDFTIRERFEGKRFALPARVYARPLEIYPGLQLEPAELNAELALLGYRQTAKADEPGTYRWRGRELDLTTRTFVFGDGPQPSTACVVRFADSQIVALTDRFTESNLDLVRLDPALIGGIYPGENEDRVLVKLDEVPQSVVEALIAVEDRRFYQHHGIDPRGIARALFMTLSGKSVQGGSTLTQQLIKNFYLTSERTVRRKLTEMVMAVLLEMHYSKEEILETYLNEVYLGQDGNRAIHGFGLASAYFFDKPLPHLGLSEGALLVGMLKGPAYYSPRKHPKRAMERRNLVLAQMVDAGFISEQQYRDFRATPLGVVDRPPRGTSPYPAFVDLVHRQLQRDYRDEDLRSEGLQVFTTLDPQVQRIAEKSLQDRLARLEKARDIGSGTLQGAAVVTANQNAEVLACVGGRDPRFEGFNRVLDARRPVGSLIKPVVFLTALQHPTRYTLATLLDDSPLTLKQPGAEDWMPQNYDKRFHGNVPLRDALMHSYNVATARLGLALGVDSVMANVRRLGLDREVPAYASGLLGVNALSPLEVAQIYQSIASGGFRTPLRAIREVLTAEGDTLQRYPLNVEQVIEPGPNYLLTTAMQAVVHEGTAQGLYNRLSPDLNVAGKTGTTDDYRDSWFAGFTGDSLAVVWVGRDDNESTGLTGASGAMAVWGDMMVSMDPLPLVLSQLDNVERLWIDRSSGLLSNEGCPDAVELPFIVGSAPTKSASCGPGSMGNSIKNWFKRIFQ